MRSGWTAWLRRARDYGLWVFMAAGGGAIHLGTALLRLGMLVPQPQLVDFGSFYAAAYALGHGLSPYAWSPDLLMVLQDRGVPFEVPPFSSPPLWGLLVWPWSLLRYPLAAPAWLLALLALLLWCARALVRRAGWQGWRATLLAWALVVSFGPTFLALTLGQSSPWLLCAALLMGGALRQPGTRREVGASLALLPALASKLFPLGWLIGPALLRRWRALVLASAIILLAMILSWALMPAANEAYWSRVLPQRVLLHATAVGLDDQSLVAWLLRMGQPQSYEVSGFPVTRMHTVRSAPLWPIPAGLLRGLGYAALALLGACCVGIVSRIGAPAAEGGLYLWVLYLLLAFPHMERYNHVLLLPAMAWLRARGKWRAGLGAYFLAALSRLTHLWVIVLPSYLAGAATGFGPLAVLLLMVAMLRTLGMRLPRSSRTAPSPGEVTPA